MAECIFTIDLGTSGPKVALIDLHGRVRAQAFEPVPLHTESGGAAEQSPEQWWSAIGRASEGLWSESSVAADQVIAVTCTSQWSATVAVDGGGKALGSAISWMDTRGAPDAEAMTAGWPRVEGYGLRRLARWIRLTGGLPSRSGKDPVAHIAWLKRARPEIANDATHYLEPKDYLNLRLCGKIAAGPDSIALHWVTDNRDLSRVRYDPGLLEWAGLRREELPDLRAPDDVLGELTADAAQHLGLPAGLPVTMGTPDVHSAAIGSGAVRDFEGHIYVGTSSWMTCHVPFKKTDVFHNMASLPSGIPQRYLVANEQETAGACLSWLRDSVFFPQDALSAEAPPADVYRRFDRLAEQVDPGAGGLIFTPWLYGERTPVEDHHVRASWFNLSLETGRAEMVRAVLEGVALNTRWLLPHLERFIGRPFPSLKIIGGGAKSPLWCQIFADVLNRPIEQVAEPLAANARGAALLAAQAIGRGSLAEFGGRVELAQRFEPRPEFVTRYAAIFAEFEGLYRRNRKAHARLNRGGRGS